MKSRLVGAATAAAFCAIFAQQRVAAAGDDVAAGEPASAPAAVRWRAGGDLRLRLEAFDDIPVKTENPALSRGGYNNYFRIRPRASLGADFGEAAAFDLRVADEFRVKNHGQKSYEWPDEAIVDQLKFSLRGLGDGLADVTLGRQDVVLGSGRLFAEGTAKDGSRTSFFDGVLARMRPSEKRTLDLFAFYGSCENDLALGHEHRDLTGLGPGWNSMDEATAGFFWEDRTFDDFGWGIYYVFLHDTAWRTRAGDRVPGESIHTFGARLMPRFSDAFSAEVESACQQGSSDDGAPGRSAGFATVGLKWTICPEASVSANALWLSGDDPDTRRREDFNILFGRYPWISELLLYGFDSDGVGTWHNLVRYWLQADVALGRGGAHRLTATVGPLLAPERDGAGGGDERGWLETILYSFPIRNGRFGNLTGHLFLEVLEPGSYYVSDDTAYFFRAQLNWAF